MPNCLNRLRNLKAARHKHQHIPPGARIDEITESGGGLFPHWLLINVIRSPGKPNLDGERAPL